MEKFITHTGIAAPLLRNNIDTDAIIPSREMKTVSKLGLCDGLFAVWRYLDEKARIPNPDFILNQPGYADASILISKRNFGCGSSREHAVWALKEYGFKCIIAESFGAIFYRNCIANGILPIQLSSEKIDQILRHKNNEIDIDLRSQKISFAGESVVFELAGNDRESLLEGLDPISSTLQLSEEINAFRNADQKKRTWLY